MCENEKTKQEWAEIGNLTSFELGMLAKACQAVSDQMDTDTDEKLSLHGFLLGVVSVLRRADDNVARLAVYIDEHGVA